MPRSMVWQLIRLYVSTGKMRWDSPPTQRQNEVVMTGVPLVVVVVDMVVAPLVEGEVVEVDMAPTPLMGKNFICT